MKHLAIIAILLGNALTATARGQDADAGDPTLGALKPVPFNRLSEPYVSNLGRAALAINPNGWKHSETDHFVYHYFNSFIATPVSVEAEFYYRVIASDLEMKTDDWERKCHIFIFEKDADWDQFRKNARLEPWTGGIHARGELFIQRNPAYKYKGHTLGHEVAHLVSARFLGGNLPLWLEEGYAEMISIIAYASFHRARGYDAKPRSRPVDPNHYIPLEQFVHIRDYPADREEVVAFYDQSHRFVRFLRRESNSDFLKLVDAMAKGSRFETALLRVYGSQYSYLSKLEEPFKEYATK